MAINFLGYNNNPVIAEGEFKNMINMSSDNMPCASPRKPRSLINTLADATGLFAKTQLCWISGTNFVYNGTIKGAVTAGEKCFVSFNNMILIFPDKKYYDVVTDVFGSLENIYTSGANQITFASNKITTTGADFTGFNVGDGITISGSNQAKNNITIVITAIAAKVLTFADNTLTANADTGAITIKRSCPDIDFATEFNNRVWGVKGDNIYACKLGDAKNWNVFSGLNTDSYATTTGTDGNFTLAVKLQNHPILMKENDLFEVYGYKPSNFEVKRVCNVGCQSGCSKSAVVINESLFYKSRKGYYQYTGGLPSLVSFALNKDYTKAVAGSDDRKLYVSFYDGSAYTLAVLDTWNNNVWHLEDTLAVREFANLNGSIHALTLDNKVYKFNSGNEVVNWTGETDRFTEIVNEKKGYSKLRMRVDLESGSSITVFVRSGNNSYNQVGQPITTQYMESYEFVMIPERSDSFQIKIVGSGAAKIYNIEREFYYGGGV